MKATTTAIMRELATLGAVLRAANRAIPVPVGRLTWAAWDDAGNDDIATELRLGAASLIQEARRINQLNIRLLKMRELPLQRAREEAAHDYGHA